ncbi:hypothetical protein BZA05DRAFT_414924 [Tricharina praecox]|uniref:uncharacterized protein n=1 Tax=Tricharina praecox TaxID=43433 RepID=UPI00222009EB|nr:uncharacterized protein BZA05DRAFT_414924 [Tricharina praecox]KAI5859226.1 hypothetical protein BZA05DRAFT_414924 [Tricharina praecox]
MDPRFRLPPYPVMRTQVANPLLPRLPEQFKLQPQTAFYRSMPAVLRTVFMMCFGRDGAEDGRPDQRNMLRLEYAKALVEPAETPQMRVRNGEGLRASTALRAKDGDGMDDLGGGGSSASIGERNFPGNLAEAETDANATARSGTAPALRLVREKIRREEVIEDGELQTKKRNQEEEYEEPDLLLVPRRGVLLGVESSGSYRGWKTADQEEEYEEPDLHPAYTLRNAPQPKVPSPPESVNCYSPTESGYIRPPSRPAIKPATIIKLDLLVSAVKQASNKLPTGSPLFPKMFQLRTQVVAFQDLVEYGRGAVPAVPKRIQAFLKRLEEIEEELRVDTEEEIEIFHRNKQTPMPKRRDLHPKQKVVSRDGCYRAISSAPPVLPKTITTPGGWLGTPKS